MYNSNLEQVFKIGSPHAFAVYQHEKLSAMSQQLKAEISALKPANIKEKIVSIFATIEQANTMLEQITEQDEDSFNRLNEKRKIKTEDYRRFQVEHNIKREAVKPDLFSTGGILGIAFVAETTLTAGLMISDGQMGIIEGMTYGGFFSAINIATGVTAGLYPARYANFRFNARSPQPQDKKVRIAAKCALLGSIGFMGILHFGAARVRILSEHAGIFSFDKVGFWETFNDFLCIGILGVGVISSWLAMVKGYSGITERVPEFLETRIAAEDQIEEDAEIIHDDMDERLEDIFEDTTDHVINRMADIKKSDQKFDSGLTMVRTRITALNDEIDRAITKIQAEIDREKDKREFIKQGSVTTIPFDFSIFDALRINEDALPTPADTTTLDDVPDVDDLTSQLETVYAAARARIQTAFINFKTRLPVFGGNF